MNQFLIFYAPFIIVIAFVIALFYWGSRDMSEDDI
jgi:hypothetical protein